jgi:acetyl-CoA synthetase
MGYDSTYDAVSDLHDPEAAWDEVVTEGDRESLNVAQESVGRHADSQETAVRIADFETGETVSYSFAALNDAANRVGNYLAEHTARADRVAAMLPPRIELYAAIFGTVKAGRIYVPLTPLFGPEALSYRLADSGTSVLFLAREYADALPDEAFPDLERVVVVDGPGSDTSRAGIDGEFSVDAYDRVRSRGAEFEAVDTHPDDIYTLKYTSGTTGQPKGVPTRHRRLVHGSGYNDYVVDLRPEDNYFVAASPAWSYGLGATMSVGVRDTGIATYRGSFDPVSFLETLEEFEVTNLMCPPTALRQVRGADLDPREYDTDVRVLVSAGEALDEESVAWCDEVFGTEPLDAYGQTEAGMLLCNYSFEDWEVKPGSAGKPLPGMRVALLDEAGNEVDDGDIGEICVRRSDVSAGTTRVYWGNPDETVRTYQGQWYRTGDLARRDEDGYYWYVSRKDEVIISAGYRIGPEEVQEALVKHDAVEEAGVVGIPDETRGEVVKAYVTVAESATPGEGLADDIRGFARSELSKHEYPREVEFVDDLPKTSSGKIKRRELGSS